MCIEIFVIVLIHTVFLEKQVRTIIKYSFKSSILSVPYVCVFFSIVQFFPLSSYLLHAYQVGYLYLSLLSFIILNRILSTSRIFIFLPLNLHSFFLLAYPLPRFCLLLFHLSLSWLSRHHLASQNIITVTIILFHSPSYIRCS